MTENNSDLKDSSVICQSRQGLEVRGRLVKLTRFAVAFEIYGSADELFLSDVLQKFEVIFRGKLIYSGRATIRNLISHGQVQICEAALEKDSMMDAILDPAAAKNGKLQGKFEEFIREWQKVYQVLPEYKLIVADIQTFLTDLRLWFEQFELNFSDLPAVERELCERQLIKSLDNSIWPSLNNFFERFELVSKNIPDELLAVHSLYVKRQLHPFLMTSPFMHRIYRKPLGYAGDYEMVRMILQDSHEGNSIFAKTLNRWFLSQIPAKAHRQRVQLLIKRLVDESLRSQKNQKKLRVFNLGCGPAHEVVQFLEQHHLSDKVDFTLLDFNEETLAYTNKTLSETKRRHNRQTLIQFIKKSVVQVAKNPERVTRGKFDLVYCAGLFDYLPDEISKLLMNAMYDMLAPGGLLIATNVDAGNPIKSIMDLIFEWHLIYRTSTEMAGLKPDNACEEDCKISSEATGCNIFIEVRKPIPAM